MFLAGDEEKRRTRPFSCLREKQIQAVSLGDSSLLRSHLRVWLAAHLETEDLRVNIPGLSRSDIQRVLARGAVVSFPGSRLCAHGQVLITVESDWTARRAAGIRMIDEYLTGRRPTCAHLRTFNIRRSRLLR